MGSIIIRAEKDAGQNPTLYLEWSSYTDSVSFVGTRAQLKEHATTCATLRDWPHGMLDQAIALADRNGSSDRTFNTAHWDAEPIDVGEGSPRDGWYQLPRDRIGAYARAVLADDLTTQHELLECWERFGELT